MPTAIFYFVDKIIKVFLTLRKVTYRSQGVILFLNEISLDLCHRTPPLICVYSCVMSGSRVLTGLSEINVQGVIHLVRTHGS